MAHYRANPSLAFAALLAIPLAGALAGDFEAVGRCHAGGTMEIAARAPYKGRAFDIAKLPQLHAKQAAIAGAEAPWLREFAGPSLENRIFSKGGAQVLVFLGCKPHDCDAQYAFGALDLQSQAYALRVTEHGKIRELGVFSPIAREAASCAKEIDDDVAKRTTRAIQPRARNVPR